LPQARPEASSGASPSHLGPRDIRLIHHATLNKANRFKKWEVITDELGIHLGVEAYYS